MAPTHLRRLLLLSSAVCLATALTGCASSAAPSRPDGEVRSEVEGALAAAGINPFGFRVDVRDGVVTLSGRVAEGGQRVEAEKLARGVPGVLRVVNLLEVGDVTG